MPSITPQMIDTHLTRAAIFLVTTVKPEPEHRSTVRKFCSELPGLLRAVGFRDLDGSLSCVMAFGSHAWDRLFGLPRPKDLHPFREIMTGSLFFVPPPAFLANLSDADK